MHIDETAAEVDTSDVEQISRIREISYRSSRHAFISPTACRVMSLHFMQCIRIHLELKLNPCKQIFLHLADTLHEESTGTGIKYLRF